MAALTVFLAPAGTADGVFAALADLSAAGLLEPFFWSTDPVAGTAPSALLCVADGRQWDVTPQQIVTGPRVDIARICSLVPLTAGDTPLTVDQERSLSDLIATSVGNARTVRARCLLARAGSPASPKVRLVVEGWHNIIVSAEDGPGPDLGRVQLPADTSAAGIGSQAAPVLAALMGLWRGVAHRPLDDAPVLPGETVRLARSFYRKVETGEAESNLRRQLLTQDGALPLPTDPRTPVTYVSDIGLATTTMADQLWAKHAAVLRGERRDYEVQASDQIGALKALKMFFGFLWAAIKNAPSAWYNKVVDSISSGVAASVNRAVFGDNSAYEVVVNNRTATGARADWNDIAAASSALSGSLGGPGEGAAHHVRDDLSALWQDYSRAALTLGDAGSRPAALPPVQVGPNRAILGRARDIVPGPAQRFNEIPAVIAATLQQEPVDATDLLGIQTLRAKLADLEQSPKRGVQARATIDRIATWQRENTQSFGVLVGRRIEQAFNESYAEVQRLFHKLSTAGEPPPEPGRDFRLTRWIQLTILLMVVITGVLAYLTYIDRLEWWKAVLIAIACYVIGFWGCAWAFMKSQQELFKLLHKRRKVLSDRDVDYQNLRTALNDVNRLSQAYGEYLSWSRALGAFLAAPLGPDDHRSGSVLRLNRGLPLSTAIGYANPGESDLANAVGYLRRELFTLSWLGESWDKLVLAADPAIAGVPAISAEDAAVWAQPGFRSGSVLDRWSTALFAGEQTSSGADVAWGQARQALGGTLAELVGTLVSNVEVPGVRTMSQAEFLSGVDRPASEPPAGDFDRTLITDLAVANGAGSITQDVRSSSSAGIGKVCVATQLSSGFPPDYLALGDQQVQHPEWHATVPQGPAESSVSTVTPINPADQFRPPEMGGGFNF